MTSNVTPFPSPANGWNAMLDLQRRVLSAYFDAFNPGGMPSLKTWQFGDITVYFPFGQGFSLYANPMTYWGSLLQQAETDAPQTEEAIVTKEASYGKQLGWLMDMVIDLADESDAVNKDDLADLKDLRDRIEARKARTN